MTRRKSFKKSLYQEGKNVMKKTIIVWLIIVASLLLVGCILVILSAAKYETNTYEIDKAFSDISITTDTADIIFALSDDGKCKVECYEEKNAKHSVTVENDVLVVKSSKSWYDYIGFNFGSPKITVYLPKAEYNALSIHEATGNVEIPKDYSFENVDFSLSTGDVKFFASASKLVKIKVITGNIRVENTSADALDLSVTTGNVTVSGVTCRDDITVNVVTGNAYLADSSCRSVISSGITGNISLDNVIQEVCP